MTQYHLRDDVPLIPRTNWTPEEFVWAVRTAQEPPIPERERHYKQPLTIEEAAQTREVRALFREVDPLGYDPVRHLQGEVDALLGRTVSLEEVMRRLRANPGSATVPGNPLPDTTSLIASGAYAAPTPPAESGKRSLVDETALQIKGLEEVIAEAEEENEPTLTMDVTVAWEYVALLRSLRATVERLEEWESIADERQGQIVALRAEVARLEDLVARQDAPLDYMTMKCDRLKARIEELNAEVARLREDGERMVKAVVEMSLPYEALRMDAPSQKWIAPSIWSHIVKATEAARAIVAARSTPEGTT